MPINMTSKVYVRTDEEGRILQCEGGYTMGNIKDVEQWVCIDERAGEKFDLCQSLYFDALYTDDGIPRWKWENGACVLRTEEEVEADRAGLPAAAPSQLDRIEAQVTYTAMMTDTLMEV